MAPSRGGGPPRRPGNARCSTHNSLRFPTLSVVIRMWHGARDTLNRMFLPTYERFWPNNSLWPNSNLVLIWDQESKKDYQAAAALHYEWDARLALARDGAAREGFRASWTTASVNSTAGAWVDIFEAYDHYLCSGSCFWPKRGMGYLRQLGTTFLLDEILEKHRAVAFPRGEELGEDCSSGDRVEGRQRRRGGSGEVR